MNIFIIDKIILIVKDKEKIAACLILIILSSTRDCRNHQIRYRLIIYHGSSSTNSWLSLVDLTSHDRPLLHYLQFPMSANWLIVKYWNLYNTRLVIIKYKIYKNIRFYFNFDDVLKKNIIIILAIVALHT